MDPRNRFLQLSTVFSTGDSKVDIALCPVNSKIMALSRGKNLEIWMEHLRNKPARVISVFPHQISRVYFGWDSSEYVFAFTQQSSLLRIKVEDSSFQKLEGAVDVTLQNFSITDKMILATAKPNKLLVWNPESLENVHTGDLDFEPGKVFANDTTLVVTSADNKKLFTFKMDKVELKVSFDIELAVDLEESDEIKTVTLNTSESTFSVITVKGILQVWSTQRLAKIQTYSLMGDGIPEECVVWNSGIVYQASQQSGLCWVDYRHNPVSEGRGLSNIQRPTLFRSSQDSSSLLLSSEKGPVEVWRILSSEGGTVSEGTGSASSAVSGETIERLEKLESGMRRQDNTMMSLHSQADDFEDKINTLIEDVRDLQAAQNDQD